MQQIWFITGSSRGFGRALVQAALEAGDLVVATARRPEQLAGFAERYGDRVLPLALDVTDADAVQAAVNAGVERSAASTSWSTTPATRTSRRSRPATRPTSAPSSRPTSGASITCRRRSSRSCAPRAAAPSCSSPRSAAGWADPRHRQLPGRQVRRRRLQPGARGRDRAVRGDGHGRRAQRLRDRLGRLLDAGLRHPSGLRRHDRGHAAARARQLGRRQQANRIGRPRSSCRPSSARTPLRTCCSG